MDCFQTVLIRSTEHNEQSPAFFQHFLLSQPVEGRAFRDAMRPVECRPNKGGFLKFQSFTYPGLLTFVRGHRLEVAHFDLGKQEYISTCISHAEENKRPSIPGREEQFLAENNPAGWQSGLGHHNPQKYSRQ